MASWFALGVALLCCSATTNAFRAGRGYRGGFQWDRSSFSANSLYQFNSGVNGSTFDVSDFGAVGDGKTDNTAPFQSALDAANKTNGGIVLIPSGNFMFSGSLTVPKAVTLQGTYKSVPSHTAGQNHDNPVYGTILMPTAGKGNESAAPFITLSHDSSLRGATIYYPNQPPDQQPTPFPWTVVMTGENAAVTDVECLNCFNAIRAVGAARHYIARVQGQPINTGIYVDETYDIGRVEDVHFNPWYCHNDTFMNWQLLHGRAFVFARTDWEYVFNTFAFGYAIGYHFVASSEGSCNGNFLGIGADKATNASVQVDASDAFGILITNGEFTAFGSPYGVDSSQVVVSPSNTGSVRFVNSAFWGPSNSIAKISGSGTTGFGDCTFVQWDNSKKGRYAIEVDGAKGNLLVTSNDFQHDGNQVDLGQTTLARAVVTGNVVQGSLRVSGKAHNTQIGLNADSSSN